VVLARVRRDTTLRLQSHERHYSRLYHEHRTRDEAMRMEARIAAASDELLPAMRTAVERVDDKVERVNDKVDKVATAVSAMAEELSWVRRHLDKPEPLSSQRSRAGRKAGQSSLYL
jgi:predicted  nucleic acid-binding Zn-ribbon protein